MSHQVNAIDGVLTIRLDGRASVQQLYQDIRNILDRESAALSAILDVTHANGLDQNLKAMFYRVLQHMLIKRVALCGVTATVQNDVTDLASVLSRVRPVTICQTEVDARAELGLSAPMPEQKKLSGMLAYLKKA